MQKSRRFVSTLPMPEVDFVRNVTARRYLLPEYTTHFVVAKDLYIHFTSLDPSISSELLAEAAHPHMRGNYGPFSFSSTIYYQHLVSHTQASTTPDGLILHIPGAQVIGYVTKVLPTFPKRVPDSIFYDDSKTRSPNDTDIPGGTSSVESTASLFHPHDPDYATY